MLLATTLAEQNSFRKLLIHTTDSNGLFITICLQMLPRRDVLTTGEYNYVLITMIIAGKLPYIVGSKFSGFPENCQTTKLTPTPPPPHTNFSHYMVVTIIIYASSCTI